MTLPFAGYLLNGSRPVGYGVPVRAKEADVAR